MSIGTISGVGAPAAAVSTPVKRSGWWLASSSKTSDRREPMTENRPRMRLEKLASILSYGVLLPFALAWLFLTLRRNRISALILILFLSFTLVHAVSLSKVRYRLPLDSFVIIYGVGGAIALLRTLARRAARSRPAGAPAANAG